MVISLVERGWSATRQCSLSLTLRGHAVTHLVKGRVNGAVRRLIVLQPREHFVALPRNVFWLVVWSLLAGNAVLRRVRWLLVDNERTLATLSGFCRVSGVVPVLVRQCQGVELVVHGAARKLPDVFGLAGCDSR